MRLIDADAFKKYLDDCDCCKNCTDGAKRMYICDDCPLPDCCDYRWERIINEQSTVDAVPVAYIESEKKRINVMVVEEATAGNIKEADRLSTIIAVMDAIISNWRYTTGNDWRAENETD